MLDRLPPQLQQHLLLEWLSPEAVWTLVRSSGETRRAVLSATSSLSPGVEFRAAEYEVLSEMCVRWFREQGLTLRLWTAVITYPLISYYYTNGRLQRDGDLPAVVWLHGTHYWFKRGKMHRDGDLPAEVRTDGSLFWYQNGLLHRDGDLPAVVEADGTQMWWMHGRRVL